MPILFGSGFVHQMAGNRRLLIDQYCALILMSLFSPAIESLRDLQRACALDKVRKRLGSNYRLNSSRRSRPRAP